MLTGIWIFGTIIAAIIGGELLREGWRIAAARLGKSRLCEVTVFGTRSCHIPRGTILTIGGATHELVEDVYLDAGEEVRIRARRLP